MFDGVAVLRCVVLIWLVAEEAFWATPALVFPVRYDKSISMFTQIARIVRKRGLLPSGRTTISF